jgi:hypothetical protein
MADSATHGLMPCTDGHAALLARFVADVAGACVCVCVCVCQYLSAVPWGRTLVPLPEGRMLLLGLRASLPLQRLLHPPRRQKGLLHQLYLMGWRRLAARGKSGQLQVQGYASTGLCRFRASGRLPTGPGFMKCDGNVVHYDSTPGVHVGHNPDEGSKSGWERNSSADPCSRPISAASAQRRPSPEQVAHGVLAQAQTRPISGKCDPHSVHYASTSRLHGVTFWSRQKQWLCTGHICCITPW